MALQTAFNPETGQTVVLVNNQWELAGQIATNDKGENAYLVKNQWLTDKPVPVEPASTDRTWGEAFKDVGASLVSGVGSVVQTPGQIYGLATGDFSKTGALGLGEDISQYGSDMKSEGLKARELQRNAKVQEAEKEGQWQAFKTGFSETITDPALATSFIAEQLPLLLPMIATGGTAAAVSAGRAGAAALAKGATKEAAAIAAKEAGIKAGSTAAIQTGAAMQGADIGSGAYDEIYAELSKTMSPEKAAEETLNKARAAGVAGYALSVLANKYLYGGKAIEEILSGKTISGSRIASGALTALKEIPAENVEEVGGKIAQNIAAKQAGLDKDLLSGTGETAALATIGAAGLGGVSGIAARKAPADAEAKQKEDAFKQEEEQFKKEFGAAEAVDAPVEEVPPKEFPGGYVATRREASRQEVPESFGIFAEGSEKPLTTVISQEDADKKLQTLSEIRSQEQTRLAAESEKLSAVINEEQRKIDVMEATGLTGTDEYVQATALLEQKKVEATEKIDELAQKITDYSAPLNIAPIGSKQDIQYAFDVNKGDESIGSFTTIEEAEAALREREPTLFKQADLEAQKQEEVQAEQETRQVDERVKTLETQLTPLLTKFNLQDVGLKVVKNIENNAGGKYFERLIQVAIDEPAPMQTMRHESMHALKDLGFFTPQQWKALEEQATKKWIKQYLYDQPATADVDGKPVTMSRFDAYKRLGYSQEAMIEEAIADAFGAYDKGAKPPPGMIAALFKKLKNFFLNLGQAMRGAGFESADDIFQRVERGELKSKKAKPVATPATVTTKPLAKEAEEDVGEEAEDKYSLAGEGVPLSTRNIMEQATSFAQSELGLNIKKRKGSSGANNVRDVAKVLNQQTQDQFGVMDRKNLSTQNIDGIAQAIADEVGYQVRSISKTGSGLGWYSNNYPKALKKLGSRFPELRNNELARSVFSALVAVTSNGEDVSSNIKKAIKLYSELRMGNKLLAGGSRRITALENNLEAIQSLLDEHGENFQEVLTQEITVAELNAHLRSLGKEPSSDYLANTKIPASAIYFGPKLGAFFANLSGAEGYLTMDLWWTRSINRMRGLLMPEATESSIKSFRDLMDRPSATRDEVIGAAIPFKQKYEEHGYNTELEFLVGAKEPAKKKDLPSWLIKAKRKAGAAFQQLMHEHKLEKMANTIYKNEFDMLEEAPFNASDRKFMYDVARKAQNILSQEGLELSLADIQAALWYYEKRLYAKLTGREADDIGYEEAIIAQSDENHRREGPSVVFSERFNGGNDTLRKIQVLDESGGVSDAKFSIKKGIIAEVAPNPDHIAAEKWRDMTSSERLNATKAVANKVMSSVFGELGLRGYTYVFSTGKYEGEVNPNILVEAPDDASVEDLDELGRVLGYVLDQKAMVVFDEDNKRSDSQAGFVKVRIPEGMSESDLDALRKHIARAVPQADGDTLRDGSLIFGNFSEYNDNVDTVTDKQYHQGIVDAIESFEYENEIHVSAPIRFHSNFLAPEQRSDYLKDTRYGKGSSFQRKAGSDVWRQGRSRLEAISESAIVLRDRWIDARGAARLSSGNSLEKADYGKPTEEYGKATKGSVKAVGVHFSQAPRAALNSAFFGNGIRGAEAERLNQPENYDIKNRVYFYVDNGKGIFPEVGVGNTPHVIKLNNLYDAKADPLSILKNVKGSTEQELTSNIERTIKDAGFDGFLSNDPVQSQNYAVLLGYHVVPTGKLSLKTTSTAKFKRWFGGSTLLDANGEPKVMYHGTARDITEFKGKQAGAIFVTENPDVAGDFAKMSATWMGKHAEQFLDDAQLAEGKKQAIEAIRKDYGKDTLGKEMLDSIKAGNPTDEALEYLGKAYKPMMPSGPNIMPVYVRAETPFDYENPSHVQQVVDELNNNSDSWGRKIGEKERGDIARGNWERIETQAVQQAMRGLGFDSFYVREGGRKNLAVYSPTQIKSATGNSGDYSTTNPDIRYSLPSIPANMQGRIDETTHRREQKGFAQRMIEAISPKSVSHFRQAFLNRYNQMSVYDKERAKQMGGSALLADQSAESAALMSDLGSGVAASAMGLGDRHGGIPVLRNGITTINRNVKGLIASLSPLAAYGDSAVYQRYQYWAMVKRGVRLNAEGRNVGITTADVAFAKMLEQKHPEFVSVQKDLIAFNNGIVQYMVDTGVLSKERGQIYTKHADYIPFYRQIDGETTQGPNLFQSLSGVKPPKQLKGGSDAPIADFLETMVRNTQSSINAGIKNYAAQRALTVASQVKAAGMGATRLNTKESGPDIINVLEKGDLVSYRTPDHLLINAMMSLNQSEIPFMHIWSAPANVLRSLVTKDPGFMMANLLRDSLSAWVTSGQSMTPIAGTVINFGKALVGKSKGYEAMMDAGILGGYEFSDNVEKSGLTLEKDLAKKAGQKGPLGLRTVTSLWAALEKGTTASDAATRALIYERVLAETGNEAEALFRSLEVMNFHRKGSSALIRVLTAAVPFFNARLQGLDLFYRASTGNMNNKDAAAIQRKFLARGATMMALSAMYWMLVSDDDEYKKQEQENKDNYWILPSVGIRIPIPFEVGVLFKVIPERIAAYLFGDDTGEDLKNALKRNAMSTFAFNPVPQTVKPLVEAIYDFNTFTWRPIVGESMSNMAPEYQTRPGTSKVATEIGGILGLSPLKVDHVIKGYTGTMGMYAIDTIDTIMDQFSDSPRASKRFEQLPVFKRFLVDPEARGNITQYYQLKDAVDTTVRTLNMLEKTGESEAYMKYLTENMGTFAYKDYIRDTEKTMKELREARRAVQSSSMSGDDKRDALTELGRAEDQITSQIQEIKKSIASMQ